MSNPVVELGANLVEARPEIDHADGAALRERLTHAVS
jgi:hypothetical protein